MPSVLITGAGRGIGRSVALRLAASGWHVYAGVRSLADGQQLAGQASGTIEPVRLDITAADQVAALRASVPSLDALVNNAGIVVGGPLEAIPVDDLRDQLEVNVIGQVAVTQAVLPLLRATRGRVLFMSSLSGRVATPMTGAYNASKFALEGLADALRMELSPWKIGVSLIEPAQIDTALWQDAEAELDATVAKLDPAHRELYAGHIEGFRRMIPVSQKLASPTEKVAATVERALMARRLRARYIVGAGPKVQAVAAGLTPTPVLDALLRRASGVPGSL